MPNDRKVEESGYERRIDVEREPVVRLRRGQRFVRLVDRSEVVVGVLVVRVVDEDLTVVGRGLGEATGLLGGPFFLFLLWQSRRRSIGGQMM